MRKTEVHNAKILFKFSYSVSSQVFNFLVNVAKLNVLLINHNFTFLVKVKTIPYLQVS